MSRAICVRLYVAFVGMCCFATCSTALHAQTEKASGTTQSKPTVTTGRPSPPQIESEAKRQQRVLQVQALHSAMQIQRICANSPIPAGWVRINDEWSPTTCGMPTTITDNVWIIERYDQLPVGSILNVCTAGLSVPSGWVIVGSFWGPASCGQPSNITDNMTQIKRVS
jgi:hypothetical protein